MGGMQYQNEFVSVDDRFARFGEKSFAINKINSVEVRQDTKNGGRGYIGFWFVAIIALASALSPGNATSGIVIAAVCGGLGYLSWMKRQDTHTYRLFLVTSSSEAQAFETKDRQQINDLRHAIEAAMARSS